MNVDPTSEVAAGTDRDVTSGKNTFKIIDCSNQ